jgi:hypothetical protein
VRREQEVMPSRIINDQRGVFGLWMSDFGAAILVFVVWSKIFEGARVEILAVAVAIVALVILSPIRLTTRRKIIRDAIGFYLTRRIPYDPIHRSFLS